MPLKVRCPDCERVVKAPDRARGKAVKCPQCGRAIRVPAEKTRKAVAPPPSSSSLIANLDLDRLEDAQNRICPKCGAEVSLEDAECPECHVNLDTGLLSAEKKAELSRKGPNPKLYYKEFLRDGFEFWKKNNLLWIRLCWFSAAFTALAVGCAIVGLWASKPLARYFWFFCSAVAILIPPGLAWNLHVAIVDATVRKKKKLGKYHFDKLLGTALGLKLIFWFLEIVAPLHILAVVFLALKFWLVAASLELAAIVFAAMLFPLSMSHMAMPITARGWFLHKLSKPFFRTIPGLVYWCFFLFLTLVPALACLAVAGLYSGKDVSNLAVASAENAQIVVTKAYIEDMPRSADIPKNLQEIAAKTPTELHWSVLMLPASLLIGAAGLFGAAAVFSMRTNGLFTYYFMSRLDLETMAKEVKYVPKAVTLDELESKPGLTWGKVLGGVGIAFGLGLALGSISGTMTGKPFLTGIASGILIAGGIVWLVGFFWLLFEAFQDSMVWFGAILITSQSSWVLVFYFGWIGLATSVLLPFVYGVINWSNAKFPVMVLSMGYVFSMIGVVVLVLSVGLEAIGL